MKYRQLFLWVFCLLLLGCAGCLDETPPIKQAPTPNGVTVADLELRWIKVTDVDSYTVEVTIGQERSEYRVTDNTYSFAKDCVDTVTFTFRVKANASAFYTEDSNYSEEYIYTYQKPVPPDYEILILEQNLVNMAVPPTGWTYQGITTYADGSLKFANEKNAVTTPTFKAYTSFYVDAVIKGNNTAGDATITMYGLDKNQKVVEKQEFIGTIAGTKYPLRGEFTNTDIVQIKLEYTKKATGNLGLYQMYIAHDEDTQKLVSIALTNYQTNYLIGETFSTKGNLVLTYKDQTTKTIPLADVMDDITLAQFDTTLFGTRVARITYQDFTYQFEYEVHYSYDAIYRNPDAVEVYFLSLPNQTHSLAFLKVGTLDILIGDFDLSQVDLLHTLLQNYMDDAILEYVFSNQHTAVSALNGLMRYYQMAYLISSERINHSATTWVSYEAALDFAFHLAPSVTLSVISMQNQHLVLTLDALGTTMLFAGSSTTTEEITYLDKLTQIDILQCGDDKYSTGVELLTAIKPQDYLMYFTPDTSMAPETVKLIKRIYQYKATSYIFNVAQNGTIMLSITPTGYSFHQNDHLTEFSKTAFWQNFADNGGIFHVDPLGHLFNREDYYHNILELTGNALEVALRNLITETHTYQTNYGEARATALLTDYDPNQPGNIVLLYSGYSIPAIWDNGLSWNREHVWPKALSGGLYTSVSNTDNGAGADLHQLKPASPSFNSSRNSKPYGPQTDSNYFAPRDEVKGDVARIIFYMAIRYNMNMMTLKVTQSIALLLSWNELDPVDYLEQGRNEAIAQIQGNYNPFIDNPWLANEIWH